ncbi:zinc finger protein 281 [Hemibagrus wyckioides]|nr:zinc finger protein 281 [Hemibagrus wyckioides]
MPVMETGSPKPDGWNRLEKRKGKAKLKLKKKHYCLYCRKPSLRMAQHLLSAHANEPEVAKALSYDRKSKERKQLLDLLQSKGSLLHKDVGMNRTLVSSNQQAKARYKDTVQCIYCLGLYSRKVITSHVKRCKHKYPYRAEAGTARPIASTTASQPGASLINEQLAANQASLPNSHGSCSAKQEKPNPQCLSSHVSDTHHSAAQLYADTESSASPCEDFGLVGEQLLAELESHDFTPDTSLIRNDHMNINMTCSSPADNQTETCKSEDKETLAEQSSQNGHTVVNRRRSFHNQSKVIYTHSDEEESAAQNTQLHICQHCSATFCSPYHLRRHEYTHTGERPFWCSECNVGFIQKYRYRNHRMIHHERHINVYKDQSRRRKTQSGSGERPAETELLQQRLAESPAGTAEPFNYSEERVSLN